MNQNSAAAHILLVEDDVELAQLTQTYLSNYGFNVQIEADGAQAVKRIVASPPDLAIVDLMLPSLDGISLCREVRRHCQLPIILLTASREMVDQVVGLELGADDFISKPVEPRLLLARVRALLRRSSETSVDTVRVVENDERLKFGEFIIDNGSRTVLLHQRPIELSGPEFDLLWLLASHAGEILSRDEIFRQMRGIDYDGSNRTIDAHIAHLRSKLAADAEAAARIKTVRNKGYLFAHYSA
jgi:two-component system response regulator RstA